MALINCKVCGYLVSEKAAVCPRCGNVINDVPMSANHNEDEKPKWWKSPLVWGISALLLCALVGAGIYVYLTNEKDNKAKLHNQTTAVDENADETAAQKARIDSLRRDSIRQAEEMTAGLNMRIFTEKKFEDYHDGKAQLNCCLSNEKMATNLKSLGFTLSGRRNETREVYYGGEYYTAVIETYSKTVNGRVTTVKLDEDFVEITFPNQHDVDDFKESIVSAGMIYRNGRYEDPSDVYWTGTDASINGTVVTLNFRWEP